MAKKQVKIISVKDKKLSGTVNKIVKHLSNRILNNLKSISIHLFIWMLILTINFIFLRNYTINFDLTFHILTWVVYISLFYITYSLLIPLFLFRKKIIAFIAGSLVVLAASYLINDTIARNQFITVFRQMENTPQKNSFGPAEFRPDRPGSNMPPPQFNKEELKRLDLEMMLQNKQAPGGGPNFRRILFPLYGLLLIYFAGISARVLVRFRDEEKNSERIMKERITTELLYLKQQINPHFLFNTLNNIYSLSLKDPELTPSAILKVSSILRYTLYKTDNLLALLKDEIEIIDDYIDLQKMRFKNMLPISYSVTGQVRDYKIEPFILLPLIENAFKYGMLNPDDSYIDIEITINSDSLKFYIRNKKSVISESDPGQSGIGLKNIKRRLDLVYSNCHEFRIEDEDDNFSVFLVIPLRT